MSLTFCVIIMICQSMIVFLMQQKWVSDAGIIQVISNYVVHIQVVISEVSQIKVKCKQHPVLQSLHILLTYLRFSEQVTSLPAWTAAAKLTLSKNKVLRTTLDLLAVSSLIAYEAIWWPLKLAFAWVKWIIYLGFACLWHVNASYPRASS